MQSDSFECCLCCLFTICKKGTVGVLLFMNMLFRNKVFSGQMSQRSLGVFFIPLLQEKSKYIFNTIFFFSQRKNALRLTLEKGQFSCLTSNNKLISNIVKLLGNFLLSTKKCHSWLGTKFQRSNSSVLLVMPKFLQQNVVHEYNTIYIFSWGCSGVVWRYWMCWFFLGVIFFIFCMSSKSWAWNLAKSNLWIWLSPNHWIWQVLKSPQKEAFSSQPAKQARLIGSSIPSILLSLYIGDG